MLIRIDRIRALGIQYGDSVRQSGVRHMVVANNKVDAFLLGVLDLLDRFDTAIQRDNQRHAVLGGIIDTLVRDTVPLVVSIWDIEIQGRRVRS